MSEEAQKEALLLRDSPRGEGEARWGGALARGGAVATLTVSAAGCALVEAAPPSARRCLPRRRLALRVPAADLLGATVVDGCCVELLYAPLTRGGGGAKPARALRAAPPLRLASAAEAAAAVSAIQRAARPAAARPGRVCVVVNPASGTGRAAAAFERDVRPALAAAGIEYDVHVTRGSGHATTIVRALDPAATAAIAVLGGDGTAHEALQGLLNRADWAAAAAVPLLQAPAGSGNALAASAGLWSVAAAAHALVKGAAVPLDVMSVMQPSARDRFYGFLSVTYGTIAAIDIGTERWRWMGGQRFVAGALREALLRRSYPLSAAALAAHADADGAEDAGGGAAAALRAGGAGPPLRHAPALARLAALMGAGGGGGALEAPAKPDGAAAAALPRGWAWLQASPAALFGACNLPRLDGNTHFAPGLALDSGDLMLVHTVGAPGRLAALQLLTAAESGAHVGLPAVRTRRLVALALEPRAAAGATSSRSSRAQRRVVVDGEAAADAPLLAEVHPSLCRVLVAPAAA
jgi:sphingosine kinase